MARPPITKTSYNLEVIGGLAITEVLQDFDISTIYKVIILQASCRKVGRFPTKIVVNLIEIHFKVKIFPANCLRYNYFIGVNLYTIMLQYFRQVAGKSCSGIPHLGYIATSIDL